MVSICFDHQRINISYFVSPSFTMFHMGVFQKQGYILALGFSMKESLQLLGFTPNDLDLGRT